MGTLDRKAVERYDRLEASDHRRPFADRVNTDFDKLALNRQSRLVKQIGLVINAAPACNRSYAPGIGIRTQIGI